MKKLKFKGIKRCPNCGEQWDGVECKHCGFDAVFDPFWD